MALLSLANVELAFGQRRILNGANLTLDAGEHVGLVGVNGSGKSTLLKLMAGLGGLRPDAGQVQLARGATAGYLTQDPDLDLDLTLREEAGKAFAHLHDLHRQLEDLTHRMAEAQGEELDRLLKQYERVEHRMQAAGGYAVDHRIDATLHGLGLEDHFFNVKVRDLSGGQKGRLALAKLLLSDVDVLLLDEPTNHLDITGREWLEQYLSTYAGAVLLVSHDRWLLDRVAKKIYELEAGKLYEYPGNFQTFRELRAERRITQQRVYEKQRDRIRQEQAFIDRYRAGQRARQAKGREKRLERFISDEIVEAPLSEKVMNLQFKGAPRASDLIVTADQLSKGYENKPLFSHLSMAIKRGDRFGIIGPNGAGKSTLVRCLLGELPPTSGTVRLGGNLSVGYYRQTHEGMDLSRTVVEYMRQFVPNGLEQEARDLAGAFLFSGESQDKQLGVLSGGERSRAVLAGLVAGGHNVLVLDEPTNHLDIPSAERLEQALKQFVGLEGRRPSDTQVGTLLLITHDRMLLDQVVDQLLILDGHGRLTHFYGTYSDYLQAQQQAATQAERAAVSSPSAAAGKPKGDGAEAKARRSNGAKAGRAEESGRSGAPGRSKGSEGSGGSGASGPSGGAASGGAFAKLSQQALEKEMVRVESALAEIDAQLADPDIYRDGGRVRKLQQQREQHAAKLAPLEQEWLRRAE